ncbi:nucleic acid-binding protein [Basidiobolus meristosporus CBS 931.73]|uniref:Nucleic acid-binding protein n=1 Tax=Basidiobolus meristosporus CBS 931.73 TaxID=1314790 RepID=A0A1Y1Y3Z4_9FUNG|nr:nucleic acid-binding protein [Basidiobolus meristosporus CBS 931.73]|eukprot:ORX92752.1 nucleic acid-binding protein [Basidiobolus meristosporus CBS 931.73]
MSKLVVAKADQVTRLVVAHYIPDIKIEEADVESSQLDEITDVNQIVLQLAAGAGHEAVGKEASAQAEVKKWLEETVVEANKLNELARKLNDYLATRTYLVDNYLTLADLVTFARIYPFATKLPKPAQPGLCNLFRWIDLIQNTTEVHKAGLELIPVNLEAPKVQPKDKKKDKKDDKKDEKKEKKGSDRPKQPKAAEPLVMAPSLLDLRVGYISKCERHPDADSLYVETIEVGEAEPRTVISGLVKYIPIEKMQGIYVVLVCNLKPANMRGIKSHAMVLAATSPDGNTLELVTPPAGSKPGDRVYFEGYEDGKPEAQLNPKKKIFETLQPGLKTNDDKVAMWADAENKPHLMRTEAGLCTVPSVVGASIK